MGDIPVWTAESPVAAAKRSYRNICVGSILAAFAVGFVIGLLGPAFFSGSSEDPGTNRSDNAPLETRPEVVVVPAPLRAALNTSFHPVTFVEENGIIDENIYWGKKIEDYLPTGFGEKDNDLWNKYVQKSVAVRLEPGCGRMQNRLVTFQDGTRGCVRYRQNLDQIQGELFSFYLAQLLGLPNLAPSAVSLVDLSSATWTNLPAEVASAQWASNRPVVVTKYISELSSAHIPPGFRPPERRLTQRDVLERNGSSSARLADLAELAQWSDLVIFDYLTANLDRVVNNLYNRQWNVNIMEAPAHNLARRDDNLLVFLDNESGLLHGYRLLHKYEPYHALLLDNLCVFRRRTVTALERLRREGNVGRLLTEMFERTTSERIRDVLPFLPEKSVKVLNERIQRVHGQITRCKRRENAM